MSYFRIYIKYVSTNVSLSKFILDITDIGVGKHREETWVYNEYKPEIANPSWASLAINTFSVWEEAFAQQWNSNVVIGWY